MPYRYNPLVTGEYYHVFNRGVAKMTIFKDYRYYRRFMRAMLYYQVDGLKPRFSLFSPSIHKLDWNKKLVDIICYCLMPNHYHFLLKQNKDGGISEFIRKLCESHAKYYNIKGTGRLGSVFQSEFKAELVVSNEQLIHLSRYIHLNPVVSDVVDNLKKHLWSSYLEYLGLNTNRVCTKEIILGQFKSPQKYEEFVLDQVGYATELEYIKHQIIEKE